MKFLESMIVWDHDTGRVDVVPFPDRKGLGDSYQSTDGACYAAYHNMSIEGQAMMLFIVFNTLVVRERMPVNAVHRAFLKIDEYRKRIAHDTPGADS